MDLSDQSNPVTSRLEADSIWLEYDNRRILQNIYLQVPKGQITGLLGRNGCGKSTLLEVIYGIRTAQNRSVRIDGMFYDKVYKHRNRVAYLPQKAFVPGHLRVKEAFALYQSDLAAVSLVFPAITDLLSYRIGQLSDGQQRLVETLLVITSPATFLLLDEPFSNVMPLHIEFLRQLLLLVKVRKGILITDHFYQDILQISDQVYFLSTNGHTVPLKHPEADLRELGYIR